jgi:hypothetical protein
VTYKKFILYIKTLILAIPPSQLMSSCIMVDMETTCSYRHVNSSLLSRHTLSKTRTLFRVDSDICSWLLMVLKGTLDFQSSSAVL